MKGPSKFAYSLSKKVGRAIADYDMINDGDRIVVAVSGGKDSLTLLKILRERQRWVPIKYELLSVYVESDYRCSGCAHRKTLEGLFRQLNCPYRFVKISLLDKKRGVSCFWCSWNRRKALFETAREFGCNKVAFGHHRDDAIQTLLLNLFYQGEFSAMPAKLKMFDGALEIIRPLIYVEEHETARYAQEQNFSTQLCACPNKETSKRTLMRQIIETVQRDCPNLKVNISNSINKIKHLYLP